MSEYVQHDVVQDWRSIELGEMPDHQMPDVDFYPGDILIGEAAAAVDGWYAEAGAGLSDLSLPDYESFCADRTAYAYPDQTFDYVDGWRPVNEWHLIRDRHDPASYGARSELVGGYASNSGLVAYVDAGGHLMMTRNTGRNQEALEAAGYRRDNFFVPFSTGTVGFTANSLACASLDLFRALDDLDAMTAATLEGRVFVSSDDLRLDRSVVGRLVSGGRDDDYAVVSGHIREARAFAEMSADFEGPSARLDALRDRVAVLRERVRELNS
ncbi:MAG TPA: hypothetical protein VF809_02455 [Candidatus Saccharimonadales bacterium]